MKIKSILLLKSCWFLSHPGHHYFDISEINLEGVTCSTFSDSLRRAKSDVFVKNVVAVFGGSLEGAVPIATLGV